MLMFRFWSSDSRGSDKTVEDIQSMTEYSSSFETVAEDTCVASPRPCKRRWHSVEGGACDKALSPPPSYKRLKGEGDVALMSKYEDVSAGKESFAVQPSGLTSGIERARDTIQYQFGLEILLKHDELRLINQELAKCQVALEQLRRCHLIPYPLSCPTPEQMLEVSNGKGPAIKSQSGVSTPRWAPPFGVVDGPYARHYAKWLIPDPAFDGPLQDFQGIPDALRVRNPMEGRTTRNSTGDAGGLTKRNGRGGLGQKLQALSSGYPQPKDKAGPCILKRSDGKTVKLVCIDCQRENFSSTQGFINHCRIAHRRDFKSHEEAAVQSGHPIELDEGGGVVGEEKTSTSTTSNQIAPGLVHPLARTDALSDQEACSRLLSRIKESLKLFNEGKLPGVSSIPGATAPETKSKSPSSFVESTDLPYLSQLMQGREINANLHEHVNDARTKVDLDTLFSPEEEYDDIDQSSQANTQESVRPPVVMRVPARTAISQPPVTTVTHSAKGRSPRLALGAAQTPSALPSKPHSQEDTTSFDAEMDVDLSPNTMSSNNAPSLVSDDGEYDDSDDASSDSDACESMETDSVPDVAEIEEDHDVESHDRAQPLCHHGDSGGVGSGPVRLKDERKHVTFVSPIQAPGNGRRKPRT